MGNYSAGGEKRRVFVVFWALRAQNTTKTLLSPWPDQYQKWYNSFMQTQRYTSYAYTLVLT
jgi:hypothetical protein